MYTVGIQYIHMGGETMFKLMKFLIKLAMLPLFIPMYLVWMLMGKAMGMENKTYSIWRF